jgi:anaerobic sulfite reductase subunit B
MHIRGPYGNGYYVNNFIGKNVKIIAGGTGVAPIKGVINYMEQNRDLFGKIDIYLGFRTPSDLLFRDEVFSKSWSEKFNMHITVDRIEGCTDWGCDVGLITKLLDDRRPNVDPNSAAIVCGPPIMIKYVIPKLEGYGFKDTQIWMSLERMMKCGVGKCGHCMIGGKYACKDGPVFNYAVVKTLPEA